MRNVICGTGVKEFCELYTGQDPGDGAISSMASVWVSEILSCEGNMAHSHGVLWGESLY